MAPFLFISFKKKVAGPIIAEVGVSASSNISGSGNDYFGEFLLQIVGRILHQDLLVIYRLFPRFSARFFGNLPFYEFQEESCRTYNCRSRSLSIPQICGSYEECKDKTGENRLHCSGQVPVAPVKLMLWVGGWVGRYVPKNQICRIQVSG